MHARTHAHTHMHTNTRPHTHTHEHRDTRAHTRTPGHTRAHKHFHPRMRARAHYTNLRQSMEEIGAPRPRGKTVNLASRMQSTGIPGRIQLGPLLSFLLPLQTEPAPGQYGLFGGRGEPTLQP